MSPAYIFTKQGVNIMALKSKKETGLPEEFEETSIEKQVSLDLGLEVEAVDIDEEAEEEKKVYYTISGKEQQYNPQWEAYSISDFVYAAGTMKSVMNVANVRPPTMATPMAMRLGVPVRMSGTAPNTVERLVMRIGRKRRSAAWRAASSLLQPVFSAIWFANSTINIPFFVTRAINKIKAINLETVLTIIDTSNKVKVRIIEGSPYNDYKSWGIISME